EEPRTTSSDPLGTPFGPSIVLAASRKVDRAGMSFALGGTGVGLNFTRVQDARTEIRVAGINLSRALSNRVSGWLHGFKDYGDRKSSGVFVGVSISFARNPNFSSSVSRTDGTTVFDNRLARFAGQEQGSVGWGLASRQTLSGEGNTATSAGVRYQGRYA